MNLSRLELTFCDAYLNPKATAIIAEGAERERVILTQEILGKDTEYGGGREASDYCQKNSTLYFHPTNV